MKKCWRLKITHYYHCDDEICHEVIWHFYTEEDALKFYNEFTWDSDFHSFEGIYKVIKLENRLSKLEIK